MKFSLDIRLLRSFYTVLETKSITKAADKLGRTQPAITLQLQRLQELTGKTLFDPNEKPHTLTEDGEMVLSYAKSILRLHDELVSRLASTEIEGKVVLGTPDLYAAYLLPAILSRFRREFPHIQIELRCHLSAKLVPQVQEGEIDLALVSRMLDFTGGEVVHREPLAWVAGVDQDVYTEEPLPLALLPPGNIIRDHAINSLEKQGRKWKIVCVSESIGGLQAAVFGGVAVSVVGRSAIVDGMRELGQSENFQPLPDVELLLYRSQGKNSKAVDTFYKYIRRYLDR